MKAPTPIQQILPNAFTQKMPPIGGSLVSAKSSLSTANRYKIIGQEITKLHTALSLDVILDIIDAKVALAMTDWADIPTHWLRRTCARARKQCEWVPKTTEILHIYRSLRARRRFQKEALNKLREKRRPRIEEGPMDDATRTEFLRQAYKNMGKDYDREKQKDAVRAELNRCRTRKLEAI